METKVSEICDLCLSFSLQQYPLKEIILFTLCKQSCHGKDFLVYLFIAPNVWIKQERITEPDLLKITQFFYTITKIAFW